MGEWTRRFFKLMVFAVASSLLFSGCGRGDELISQEEAPQCRLTVKVSASSLNGRSDSSGFTRSATQIDENEIRSLALFVMTDDGRYYPLISRYLGTVGDTRQYEAVLSVAADYMRYDSENGKYYLTARIAAVANIPENNVSHPVDNAPVKISLLSESGLIPMWGVISVEELELKAGERFECARPIEMIRAVPKLSFRLSSSIKDEYIITDVRPAVEDFPHDFFYSPGNAPTVSDSGISDPQSWYRPVEDWSSEGGIPLIRGLGTPEVVAFMPERELDYLAPNANPLQLTLMRKDGKGEAFTGKVYFCDYRDGNPDFSSSFSRLIRNHEYQYEISLAPIGFLVSFKKWIFGGKVHIELE